MTDEPQPDESEKRAQLFEAMAERIRLNRDSKFGGAFLMVPPDGEPFESLMLAQDEQSIFWAAVKTLADVAMAALEQSQRQQGFQRR